jgi:CO/xanthine dehydrogenase Mo-binding subunit
LLSQGASAVVNPSFFDYKIMTTQDMPSNANMATMIAPVRHPEGPFGAKGIGEMVMLPVAPAVSIAI